MTGKLGGGPPPLPLPLPCGQSLAKCSSELQTLHFITWPSAPLGLRRRPWPLPVPLPLPLLRPAM
eukprot:2601356-Alexandrium_andersonii.AAC.1